MEFKFRYQKVFCFDLTLSGCNFSQFTLKLTYNSLETSQNSIKRQRRETQQLLYLHLELTQGIFYILKSVQSISCSLYFCFLHGLESGGALIYNFSGNFS